MPSISRIDQLKQMLALEQKRAELQEQMDSLVQQLARMKDQLLHENHGASKSSPASIAHTPKPTRGRRRGSKRGQLSTAILSELKNAGGGGVTVSDLSKKLGLNYKNVYIWFATTGKKHAGLKKVAPATYSLAA